MDVKDGLSHAPIPKLWFGFTRQCRDLAVPEGAFPQEVNEGELDPTQWTFAFLAVKGALLESSQSCLEAIGGDLLERVSDSPI